MNSHDFNKVVMGILMFLLLTIGLHNLTEAVFHQDPMAANAFPIDISAVASASVADVAMDAGPSIEELLQMASIEKGRSVFRKCAACHTPESGGRAKIGPNLWGVLGKDIATSGEFGYSDAMLAQEGDWTYKFLNTYLTKPKDAIPKNKMVFVGLKKGSDRASVILYLRSLSNTPMDLPVVEDEEEVIEEATPDTM